MKLLFMVEPFIVNPKFHPKFHSWVSPAESSGGEPGIGPLSKVRTE